MASRVVIDTNLWISYLLTDNFKFLDQLIGENVIVILYNDQLVGEIIQVACRPKLKKYISKSELNKLIDLIDSYGEMIETKSDIHLSRDQKDDFLLVLAVDGNADYLITGDQDLLVLNKIGNINIIKMADFRDKIAKKL